VKGSGDSIPVGWFAHGRRKVFEGQKNGVKAKSAAIGIKYEDFPKLQLLGKAHISNNYTT
jgi:hypothetical protein